MVELPAAVWMKTRAGIRRERLWGFLLKKVGGLE